MIVISISWYGFANGYIRKPQPHHNLDEATLKLADAAPTGDLNEKDKRIIEELQSFLTSFSNNTPVYVKGTMQALSPSDTVVGDVSTAFEFFQNGSRLYYAIDAQTILNDSIAYVVADHEAQNILVMPPREGVETTALPLSSLTKSLKEDRYEVQRQERDGNITFRLVNEKHISCKEMRITVKKDTRSLAEVYYRLTDLDYPEEKSWDKEMTITFKNWLTGQAAVDVFKMPQLILPHTGGWVPAKNLENYQITVLVQR